MNYKVGDRVQYKRHITISDKRDYTIDVIYTISKVNNDINEAYFEEIPKGGYVVLSQFIPIKWIKDTKLARKMHKNIYDEKNGYIGVF